MMETTTMITKKYMNKSIMPTTFLERQTDNLNYRAGRQLKILFQFNFIATGISWCYITNRHVIDIDPVAPCASDPVFT